MTRAHALLLVKDGIISGTQAQIIIQHLHLVKIKEMMLAKEGEKGDKEPSLRIVPDVQGQVLNSKGMEEELVRADERKRKKEEGKVARNEAQRQKKKQKADDDEKWKKKLEEWTLKKEKWARDVETLKERGSAKKDLPKAPRKPRRNAPSPEEEGEAASAPNDDPEHGDNANPSLDHSDIDVEDADIEFEAF